jgi:hypothetical protein
VNLNYFKMTDSNDKEIDWHAAYEKGTIPWHRTKVHSKLEEYLDLLTSSRTRVKFLIPLSGKSVDIPWLYEKGPYINW